MEADEPPGGPTNRVARLDLAPPRQQALESGTGLRGSGSRKGALADQPRDGRLAFDNGPPPRGDGGVGGEKILHGVRRRLTDDERDERRRVPEPHIDSSRSLRRAATMLPPLRPRGGTRSRISFGYFPVPPRVAPPLSVPGSPPAA